MIKKLYRTHKETAHNFFWRALQVFSKQGMSFIIFYIATAYLTKETFGFYTYLLAIVSLFMIFCDFGISTATSKYVAEYGATDPKKVNKLTFTSATVTFAAGLIVSLLIIIFGKYVLGDAYPTILYFIPCLFLIPLTSVLDGIYRGKKEFKKLSIISITSGLISLVFALILIPKYGLIGAIITQNIHYLLLATIAFIFINNKIYKIDKSALKKIMS
jgi:O-antigen/teichoic acid export membrane protein